MSGVALPLRHRIGQSEPIGLFWMSLGSPAVIELAAQAAPDAIVIDAQHGLWDRQSIEYAIGIASKTAPVLVRVAENSANAIGQALDAGAEGVIVPLIETDSEAAAAVAAARFPPEGSRSGGGVRPLGRDFGAYYMNAMQHTIVGVMIESAARRASGGGDRQHTRHGLRADRDRRSGRLAQRISARGFTAHRCLQHYPAGVQSRGHSMRHLHRQCGGGDCAPQ